MHRHHILPIRLGGTNDEDNLTPPISTALHALFHKELWEHYKDPRDYIAWKALSGRITGEEARLASAKVGQDQSVLYKESRKKLGEKLKNITTKETRSKGGKIASKSLVRWQKENPEKFLEIIRASAKKTAITNQIPHEYKGIKYASKKELQMATKLSNTGFYNKLNRGEIVRLPKPQSTKN